MSETAEKRPWYLGRYFVLTLLLMLMLMFPVIEHASSDFLRHLLVSALLVSALFSVRNRRWVFRILAVLLVPVVLGIWVSGGILAAERWEPVSNTSTALFLIVVTLAILAEIIRARSVCVDVIFGSVAAYLLVGVIVALGFSVVYGLDPASLAGLSAAGDPAESPSTFAEILYFAFVTLTSVGYGDVAPVSDAARSLALFTGVFGQLYVAIVVAKLVGIYTARAMREDD